MNIVEMINVKKAYTDGLDVIDDLSLTIKQGEFVVLIGPSGCGKTTLLKLINKLIPFETGYIYLKGKPLSDWDNIELRRSIGYVIQQVGLFPHMTIEDNIGYVLSLENVRKRDRYNRVTELIELVGMEKSYLSRYPAELSGGQKQRVGVARALASDPEVILMDEPFGAVDEIARVLLQDELMELQKQLSKTILFVTHDISEALKLGTKIVLMNKGKIEQLGTKEDLLFRPYSSFVKDFLGIKGFKSMLDGGIMNNMYDKVLSNQITLEEMYGKLRDL